MVMIEDVKTKREGLKMGEKMLIKEAAAKVGISEWELRQGVRSGKYPALKVGNGAGKYIVDTGLLEARIEELMLENIRKKDTLPAAEFGGPRRLV